MSKRVKKTGVICHGFEIYVESPPGDTNICISYTEPPNLPLRI